MGRDMTLGYVTQYQLYPVKALLEELSKTMKVKQLMSDRKSAFDSNVYSEKYESVKDGYEIFRYASEKTFRGVVFPEKEEFMKTLALSKPSIIQSDEYYQPASHAAYQFAKKKKIPFILNIRRNNTTGNKEEWFFNVANKLSEKIVDGADSVICLCQQSENWFLQQFPAAEDKTRIIPNAIDPEKYASGSGERFRQTYGIKEETKIVLNVSRIHPDKNLGDTITIFAAAIGDNINTRLLIIGRIEDHGYLKRLQAQTLTLGIQNHVTIMGELPQQTLIDAYHAADVVLLTSIREPFGNCILEAFSCCKPVVAYDVGGVSDMVTTAHNGFKVDAGDVTNAAQFIGYLLQDDMERMTLGNNGLKTVHDKFLLSATAEKMMGVYKECLR